MLLKQIVGGFMLLCFMAHSFSSGLIILDYYTNTASFAAHCVNKDKPQMHCNGHCQMVKALEKDNKTDQSAPDKKSDTKFETLSSKSFFASVQAFQKENILQYIVTNSGKAIARSSEIFHPPCS